MLADDAGMIRRYYTNRWCQTFIVHRTGGLGTLQSGTEQHYTKTSSVISKYFLMFVIIQKFCSAIWNRLLHIEVHFVENDATKNTEKIRSLLQVKALFAKMHHKISNMWLG